MDKRLQDIWSELNAQGLGSDKGNVHSYLPVYEELFAPYRECPTYNILEIGIFKGHSLLMWEKYFDGNVHAIDCSETPHDGMADLRPMIAEGTHNIYIGDATSEKDIEKFFGDTKFQVVIDDGNHNTDSQIQTYRLLKSKMTEGGIYIIEDAENIDRDKGRYLELSDNVEIIDRRSVQGRFDDALILIRF